MWLHKKIVRAVVLIAPTLALFLPLIAAAHENYVLPKKAIDEGMADWSLNVWSALTAPGNLLVAAKFGSGFVFLWIAYFIFQRTQWGRLLDNWLRQWDDFGSAVVRVVLGISLLYSAYSHVFLGPELPLASIPGGDYWQIPLYIFGALMVLGLWARAAGVGAMILTLLATFIYRDYMLTYFNYFGEFAALFVFGAYVFSADGWRAGKRLVSEKVRQWEMVIIRVTYGISILYPAISIKLLHPVIIVEIAKQYHLTQIPWLFPSDPLLISLGTGLTQIVVGLAIIIGFETRLNSAITFALYIMSILYFREAVWPHYILLALTFYLMLNNGGDWTLDSWLARRRLRRAQAA